MKISFGYFCLYMYMFNKVWSTSSDFIRFWKCLEVIYFFPSRSLYGDCIKGTPAICDLFIKVLWRVTYDSLDCTQICTKILICTSWASITCLGILLCHASCTYWIWLIFLFDWIWFIWSNWHMGHLYFMAILHDSVFFCQEVFSTFGVPFLLKIKQVSIFLWFEIAVIDKRKCVSYHKVNVTTVGFPHNTLPYLCQFVPALDILLTPQTKPLCVSSSIFVDLLL